MTCLTSTGIENWRSSKFNSRLPQPNAPQSLRPTILHSLHRVGRHETTRVNKTRPANATRVQRTRQVLSLSQVLSLRHPRTISNIRPSTLLYISLRFLLKQHFQTTPDATRLTTPKDSSCKSLTTPEDSSCKPNIQSKNPHRYPRSPTWTDLRHQRVVLCPSEELLYKYTDRDVSIYHRDPEGSVKRQILTLNPNNSGQRFRSLQSRVRTEYVEHPEWSLVNTYPAHIHTDPAGTITLQDFQSHCHYFTVLPDFWAFHATRLLVETRPESWKLNFNSEGWLALNFVPHGMAAVARGTTGALRFIVWSGLQMHGDLGERLNLKKILSSSDWNALRSQHHPGAPVKD